MNNPIPIHVSISGSLTFLTNEPSLDLAISSVNRFLEANYPSFGVDTILILDGEELPNLGLMGLTPLVRLDIDEPR